MRFQVKGAGEGWGGHQISLPSLWEQKSRLFAVGGYRNAVYIFRGCRKEKEKKCWWRQKKAQGSMEEAAERKLDKRNTAAGRQGKSKMLVQTGVEKVGTKKPTYITNIPSTSSSALESSNGWTVIEFPARLSSCISSVKHHHQSLSVSSLRHH